MTPQQRYKLKHREEIARKRSQQWHEDPEFRRKKYEYDSKRTRENPLIRVYGAMLGRCSNPRDKSFHLYGGRGIEVCHEWRKSSAAFITWAKNHGWQPGLQLDRKDNDGDYSPENCRFISQTDNLRNSRRAKLTVEKAREIRRLLIEGMTVKQLAKLFEISESAVWHVKQNRTWI